MCCCSSKGANDSFNWRQATGSATGGRGSIGVVKSRLGERRVAMDRDSARGNSTAELRRTVIWCGCPCFVAGRSAPAVPPRERPVTTPRPRLAGHAAVAGWPLASVECVLFGVRGVKGSVGSISTIDARPLPTAWAGNHASLCYNLAPQLPCKRTVRRHPRR
jgi:hypothetical protein